MLGSLVSSPSILKAHFTEEKQSQTTHISLYNLKMRDWEELKCDHGKYESAQIWYTEEKPSKWTPENVHVHISMKCHSDHRTFAGCIRIVNGKPSSCSETKDYELRLVEKADDTKCLECSGMRQLTESEERIWDRERPRGTGGRP